MFALKRKIFFKKFWGEPVTIKEQVFYYTAETIEIIGVMLVATLFVVAVASLSPVTSESIIYFIRGVLNGF